jgi:hypothetical protein
MNIDNLTIAEVREIATLAASFMPTALSPHPMIGKYVIARCYSAGVHAGTVRSVDGETVILTDSRRLWSWRAAEGLALSGVAQNGIDSSKSKLDVVNPIIYLTGVCELIPCTEKAKESIDG